MGKEELIDNDITDAKWESLYLPSEDNLHNYFIKYVIPEIFCWQLANNYSRGSLCTGSLIQHYNSLTDLVLIKVELTSIRHLIDDLLHIKYNLYIKNEIPLVLEKWQGSNNYKTH